MTDTEERALEAAWKACSAWDGKITKPVLRKAIAAALKETRSAALEEAAKICDGARDNLVIGELPHGVCVALAASIRSLIPKQEPRP